MSYPAAYDRLTALATSGRPTHAEFVRRFVKAGMKPDDAEDLWKATGGWTEDDKGGWRSDEEAGGFAMGVFAIYELLGARG